jgi:hypothetical protein
MDPVEYNLMKDRGKRDSGVISPYVYKTGESGFPFIMAMFRIQCPKLLISHPWGG